jgi:hypothetical protein
MAVARWRSFCHVTLGKEERMVKRATACGFALSLALLLFLQPGRAQTARVLGVEGDHFNVNGTPKFLIFVSYFDAMRRGDTTSGLDADLGFFRDALVDGVRIFANWLAYDCVAPPDRDEATDTLFDLNGNVDARWASFKRVLDKAAAYNLLVDVTFDRDSVYVAGGMSQAAFKSALVEVTHRLKNGYPHVYFDLQNEWPIHSTTANDIREVSAAVNAEDSTRIMTASDQFLTGAGLDFAAIHDRATGWYEETRIASLLSPGIPSHFQEPMPFSAYCPGQLLDNTPGRHSSAARATRHAGAAAWTFHTRTSFVLGGSRFVDLASTAEKAEINALRSTSNQVCWGADAVSLSPQSGTVNPSGGTGGSFNVSVNGTCASSWSVGSDATWLTANPVSGTGAGTVQYSATANTTGTARVGRLTVRGRTFTVTQDPVPASADFNGDFDTDLVWQHTTGPTAVWMMNNGVSPPSQMSGTLFNPQVPVPWRIVGTGDANRDGHTDLFLQNDAGTTTTVSVWHMNGVNQIDGKSISGAPSGIPSSWKVRAVGDFNQNGFPDLVWQNTSDGNLAVWFLNDYGFVSGVSLTPGTVSDTNWHIVGTGDVNGDRKTDLFWHHRTTGALAVWYMDGLRQTAGLSLSPDQVLDTNWQVVGVGDFNRDGKPDLIWQHTDGHISTWFMNGTQQIAGVAFNPSSPGDAQWRIVGPR